MADLTKAEIQTLGDLFVERTAIERKIQPDVERVKAINKQIDALSDKAAGHFREGQTERTRFGVRFRLITKNGRVAWRKIVESIKGQDFTKQTAAAPPTKTICVVDPETLRGVKLRKAA